MERSTSPESGRPDVAAVANEVAANEAPVRMPLLPQVRLPLLQQHQRPQTLPDAVLAVSAVVREAPLPPHLRPTEFLSPRLGMPAGLCKEDCRFNPGLKN